MSRTVLITGANRGIGLEFVRQYAARGDTVIATCRNPDDADELKTFALAAGVRVLPLNVTDPAAISELADTLAGTPVNILINNAGVYGPRASGLGNLDVSAWLEVLHTNSIAPLKLTEALLPNLRAGGDSKVVAITSRMGSIGDNSSGGSFIYRSSKAALNAAMRSAAIDLREEGIVVAILHPGWVQTDMGGKNALIDAHKSVSGMCHVIDALRRDQSGQFFSYDGSEIPW